MPKSEVGSILTRGAEVLALLVLKESKSKMDTRAFLDDVTEVMSVPDPNYVVNAAKKVLLVFGSPSTNGTDSSAVTTAPSKEIN